MQALQSLEEVSYIQPQLSTTPHFFRFPLGRLIPIFLIFCSLVSSSIELEGVVTSCDPNVVQVEKDPSDGNF